MTIDDMSISGGNRRTRIPKLMALRVLSDWPIRAVLHRGQDWAKAGDEESRKTRKPNSAKGIRRGSSADTDTVQATRIFVNRMVFLLAKVQKPQAVRKNNEHHGDAEGHRRNDGQNQAESFVA